jgi:putative NADH-flavin reductase
MKSIMQQNQTIAVLGATGKSGKYLVDQLIKHGYFIRVLLRDPAKFTIANSRIEIVQGDAGDYTAIYNLLENCHAVISTLGQRKGEPPVLSLATTHIIQAMRKQRINRYIVVTGLSIDIPGDRKSFRTKLLSHLMKWFFASVIADKQKEFSALAASSLEWTLVRLPVIELTDETGTIAIDLYDCPGKKIRATDLAVFLMQQLSDNRFIQKAPFIASI